MDPRTNPFAPGAGTPPPELAGRQKIVHDASVALGRLKLQRPAKSQMLLGFRGVGKTVLLNRIGELAISEGYETVMLEAPEDRRLAEMLVPPLRQLLFKMSRREQTRDIAKRGLAVLRAFASVFKVKAGEIEFGVEAETGTADSGVLESDMPEMLFAVAAAAKDAGTPVALFVDEVQYLSESDLAALIVSIHKMAQRSMPFVMFGAGLPQLAGLAGDAKSYAERLFDYPDVGALGQEAAEEAIATPLQRENVSIQDAALSLIVTKTKGYPYFLQEWGFHTWNVAAASPIRRQDAEYATKQALEELDRGFFRVRLDRLTPREKDYMRSMAELGPGPHRSGEIAQVLRMEVTAAGPLRSGLIRKGMVYSPQHGDTAFTVPMFDEFMRRSMPNWTASTPAAAKRKKTKGRKKRP